MTKESNSLLTRLQQLDSQFDYQAAAPAGDPWFRSVSGSVPVLVSAPHACMHRRGGQDKMQEEYTGAIALYLAESCHCSAIVTQHKTVHDPNWDEVSEYKAAIETLVADNGIQLLVDLHGMTNRHNMGVAVGTIKSLACLPDKMTSHFIDNGFELFCAADLDGETNLGANNNLDNDVWRRLVVDHPRFTGGVVNQTVTRFASQQLKIQSVQIELASEVRVVHSKATPDWPHDYNGCPHAIRSAVSALQSVVAQYQ